MLRTPEYRAARSLDLTSAERFIALVKPDPSGCWLWTGHIAENGYGYFAGGLAHRFAYTEFVGPIPDGMQIDHVRTRGCDNRHCVNWVDHLEVVTPQENTLRAPDAIATRFAARTHCDNGHEFTNANTLLRPRRDNPRKKFRACRACMADRQTEQRMSRPAPETDTHRRLPDSSDAESWTVELIVDIAQVPACSSTDELIATYGTADPDVLRSTFALADDVAAAVRFASESQGAAA
ncbi:HNH endonuclease signature motif containing protein [Micromonospora tulbaghiae]|uniref:HNH endonuclease signature motif containing protein n=1 Tax=Micromonospora tulbaghiae TaxID=479978 RepID=UPI00339E8233